MGHSNHRVRAHVAWMMNDQFGILNDMMLSLGLISQKIAWTANPETAMTAVLIVDVWKTTPFMALLILAGLQMVPKDMYEAAKVDGIHPIKVFWRVTLPMIRPALMVAVIFRMLDAMRVFDLIYILTPNNAQTRTMSVLARETCSISTSLPMARRHRPCCSSSSHPSPSSYMWLGRVNTDGDAR